MAYQFRNLTSYLELSKAVSTTYPLTFACWFSMAQLGNSLQSLIALSANGAGNRLWTLEVNTNTAQVRATQNGATGLSHTTFNGKTWHHAAATFTSDASRTPWLDGIPGPHNTTGSVANTGINVTNIGASYDSGIQQQWFGDIADAAIWQAQLSYREILDLALGRRPYQIRPGALLMWCPLENDTFDYAKGNYFHRVGAVSAKPSWPPALGPRAGSKPRSNSRSGQHNPVSFDLKSNPARTKTRILGRII